VIAYHHDIPKQVMANADPAVDPERAATELVTHKLLIQREVNWVNTFFSSGVWGTDVSGDASGSVASGETVYWSDDTNSDPIGDIRTGKTSVMRNTGQEANTLVLGRDVYDILVDHPNIVERIKYSGGVGNNNPAMVNEQTLAAVFDVDRVLVASAIQNSANQGATASHDFIAGKNALLCHTPSSPSLMQPAAGYTFNWREYLGVGNDQGLAIKRFDGEYMDILNLAARIEGEQSYDQKLISSELGYFFSGIVV